MDSESLAGREKLLAAKSTGKSSVSSGVGLRLDLLDRIIDELNACRELKEIFGDPVSASLAVYSDGADVSIVDAGLTELSEEQKLVFLSRLREVYAKTLTESFGELGGE